MSSQAPDLKNQNSKATDVEEQNFVETALKLGGKSDEEARKTGAIDRADEQVEELFARRYQTAGSPVHRAVWDSEFPVELFSPQPVPVPADCQKAIDDSLAITRRHLDQKTLLNEKKKISPEVLQELGGSGYWGMLVDKQYGGLNMPFTAFARFITKMATLQPTLAGLASVHSCIGAIDPLITFGSEEQKAEYLPKLAKGERLSAFALTEPSAGSDLTALKTTATLDGDDYVVNGEKLFITNAIPGRTIGLVCLIDGRPAVLIADLPPEENEHFQLVNYGLHALKESHNNGLLFKNFRVPKKNRLTLDRGDGLTIAYHGLNRGRVALCANAAGTMRIMLASILPWAKFRKTYGTTIDTRELVRRRIGRLAGFIVACDAITDWTGWLLHEGFRGEMECTVAKIFASETQKEAAIELFMKTHGGRAFLHGHMFGDNVHEYLAPCIYEGEGEMLAMGFFKSLIKEHGKEFFEPIGRAIAQNKLRNPNPMNPVHFWKLRNEIKPYIKWRAKQSVAGWKRAKLPAMPSPLKEHAQYAADALQRSRLEADGLMQQFQLNLADRQCAMAESSRRVQDLVVILVTSMWAAKQTDQVVQAAADVLCQDLRRARTGQRPSSAYYRTVTKLGQTIAENGFKAIAGVEAQEILMPYEN